MKMYYKREHITNVKYQIYGEKYFMIIKLKEGKMKMNFAKDLKNNHKTYSFLK